MPSMHNINIKDLKLSDFPQFSCLCELCDCGCFERGKNEHSDKCKKKKNKNKISNAITPIEDIKNFKPHSLYNDTYVKFDLGANQELPKTYSSPTPARSKSIHETGIMGRRSAKMSSKTTTSDHFKMWNSNPALIINPEPDHASEVMYPTKERNFVTTNDRMLFKNYGKLPLRPQPINHIDGSFKINQGKMTFDSSYKHDYQPIKGNIRPKMTRQEDHLDRRPSEHIPMFTETQNMVDYKYDPLEFRSVWVPKKVHGAKNLFRSHLDPHLHPYSHFDDPIRKSSYSLEFSKNSIPIYEDSLMSPAPSMDSINMKRSFDFGSDKSVRFVKSFDNTQVPMLKVLEALPNKFAKIPPIRQSRNSSQNENDYDDSKSTYQSDFQKNGLDICMSKAFRILSNNKMKNDNNNNNNNNNSNSLITIKE